MTPATISYHIQGLNGIGLIKCEQEEKHKTYYTLNKENVEKYLSLLRNRFNL